MENNNHTDNCTSSNCYESEKFDIHIASIDDHHMQDGLQSKWSVPFCWRRYGQDNKREAIEEFLLSKYDLVPVDGPGVLGRFSPTFEVHYSGRHLYFSTWAAHFLDSYYDKALAEMKQELEPQTESTKPHPRPVSTSMGWIYLYYIEGTKRGYVGRDSTGNRLHDHERGRFPATHRLNLEAAEQGLVTKSMRFAPDMSKHPLSYWERFYADKYRKEGWELVNIAPLYL